jgi:flagellum-specific ATP synthase
VERVGNGANGQGSITAFYTVLTEGDDQQDPIADASRAILDGHIVLSRTLAEEGHYPAIDVEASISRVMTEIVSPQHHEVAQRFKQIYSLYQKNQDLINVGAYTAGSDPRIDQAIAMQPLLKAFLVQGINDAGSWNDSLAQLDQVINVAQAQNNLPDTVNGA